MRVFACQGGLNKSEQLVGYFYNAPPLGVAYCLAKLRLALTVVTWVGLSAAFMRLCVCLSVFSTRYLKNRSS